MFLLSSHQVDALRDLRSELHAKKEELHQVLIEELHRQIYIKAPSPVIRYFSQNGSILHQAAITGVGGVETLLSPLSVAPAMKSKLQGMGGGSAPGTPARKKPDNGRGGICRCLCLSSLLGVQCDPVLRRRLALFVTKI